MERKRMLSRRALVLAGAVVASRAAFAQSGQPLPPPSFVAPQALNLALVLPKWPGDETLAGRADLEAVLSIQAARTAVEAAEADRDAPRGPMAWAQDVLGTAFTQAAYPKIAALLQRVHDDVRGVNRAANAVHGTRARPAERDPRVKPSLNLGAPTPSYPSARTAGCRVWAEVLGALYPDKRAALLAHADRSAWLRVIGGAHYPTDVTAGRIVAEALIHHLQRSAAYQAELLVAQG
jgi:acid phosphatase (class A)